MLRKYYYRLPGILRIDLLWLITLLRATLVRLADSRSRWRTIIKFSFKYLVEDELWNFVKSGLIDLLSDFDKLNRCKCECCVSRFIHFFLHLRILFDHFQRNSFNFLNKTNDKSSTGDERPLTNKTHPSPPRCTSTDTKSKGFKNGNGRKKILEKNVNKRKIKVRHTLQQNKMSSWIKKIST